MTHSVAATLFALPAMCFAQNTGDCSKPFQLTMKPGAQIAMHIRSGDIDIVGIKEAFLRVTCRIEESNLAGKAKISFAANDLRIFGGPENGAHFRIEVPERTNLLIRSPAGDMNVSGIVGDKDVELRAGDLIISIGRPESYRVVEGSVLAGDLRAEPFGVTKDGLFRSFRKDNPNGQYRLRAHLMAGDLTFK